LAVDRIVRYEKLQEELEEVARDLGMPPLGALPRAKGHYRTDRRSYRELMGSDLRERVAEACAPEIALMGYEF
jgi:hypothetical protein